MDGQWHSFGDAFSRGEKRSSGKQESTEHAKTGDHVTDATIPGTTVGRIIWCAGITSSFRPSFLSGAHQVQFVCKRRVGPGPVKL